jgi:hypothetical protein
MLYLIISALWGSNLAAGINGMDLNTNLAGSKPTVVICLMISAPLPPP